MLENIRLLLCPCRSGSTMLLNALAQSDELYALYQPIKSDMRYEPDVSPYRIFYGQHPALRRAGIRRKQAIVVKETIGHKTLAECRLPVFENGEPISTARPLFLFRPPAATWNSWRKYGLGAMPDAQKSFALFAAAYAHTYNLYARSQKMSAGKAITLCDIRKNPESSLQQICAFWGIGFKTEMLRWKYALFSNPNLHYPPQEMNDDRESGASQQAEQAFGIQAETGAEEPQSYEGIAPEKAKEVSGGLESLYRGAARASRAFFGGPTSEMQEYPAPP
jgi:hypothetical protein